MTGGGRVSALLTLALLAPARPASPGAPFAAPTAAQGRGEFVPPPLAVFPDRASARPGERVAVYVRSESGDVRLDVVAWRGGARLLAPRDVEVPGQVDRPEEAVDGCLWTPCAEIEVPAGARSDVYLIRVRSGDETASAPLVVRAARPGARSRALVLHPEAGLAAANEWGGASLYTTAYGPPAPAVSLRRPLFGPRVEAVANGAFLDWLAALDLAVEHACDLDLGRDVALLDPYDLVLLPHRHAYWTSSMRATLDAFVLNGGRVLVLGGGCGIFHARLEDHRLFAPVLAEEDPWYRVTRYDAEIAGPYAHGPVLDPEDRSFGIASRHAYLGLPRSDGFGYLRAHEVGHPFLRDLEVNPEGLFGRRGAGDATRVAVGGASDGANLERLDGSVLASRASGAPPDLRVLATAPATAGFACVAEHRRFGSVAHLGSEALARHALQGAGLPDVQTLLRSALAAYGPPRRSLVRNGGFQRWTRLGDAWTPVGFQVQGAPYPAAAGGGDLVLGGDRRRPASVWQEVALPPGDVHLVAWANDAQCEVRLDVGNGFVLTSAGPAGATEASGGYRYARATVEEPRDAFLTCALPRHEGARIDLVEVVPEDAWRRALVLDWRLPALGSGETRTSEPVLLDAGSTYLVVVAGFGSGRVTIPGPGDVELFTTTPSGRPGEIGAGVLRLGYPGESGRFALELQARTTLTDVEVGVLPLNVPCPAPARAPAVDMSVAGDWTTPADGGWETVPGVAGRGVGLADERIAIPARLHPAPGRITLWTRGLGTLHLRLSDAWGTTLLQAALRGERDRWTPHLVRLERLPVAAEVAGRLELIAEGPVQVDRLRMGSERLALRDDHLPNGAFELVPSPPEAAREATDWHDRPPGWAVAGGTLLLDPADPWRGDHALRIEPADGRATAQLRVPDPLRLDRAWRATLAARAGPGARGEAALLVGWPGREERVELARAELAEAAWSDVSLGATAAELEGALDTLGVPHRRPRATALAWIELVAEGGRVWIDDLTLDED